MIKQLDVLTSISRILSTPLGSRVMMPEYGSELFTLIDKSVNDEWVLDAIRYTYEAIEKNEPRVIVKDVKIRLADVAEFHIEYEEGGIANTFDLSFSEVIDAAA